MPSPTAFRSNYAAPTYAALRASPTVLTQLLRATQSLSGGFGGLSTEAARLAFAWSTEATLRRAIAHILYVERNGDSYYTASELRDLNYYHPNHDDGANRALVNWESTAWMMARNVVPTRQVIAAGLTHLLAYTGPMDRPVDDTLVPPTLAAVVEGAQRLQAIAFSGMTSWLREQFRAIDPAFQSNSLAIYAPLREFYTAPREFTPAFLRDLRRLATARADAHNGETPSADHYRLPQSFTALLNTIGFGGTIQTHQLSHYIHTYGNVRWEPDTVFYYHPGWEHPDCNDSARSNLLLLITPCCHCGQQNPARSGLINGVIDPDGRRWCYTCNDENPRCYGQCGERAPTDSLTMVITGHHGEHIRLCARCRDAHVTAGRVRRCATHDVWTSGTVRCAECAELALNDFNAGDPTFYGRSTRQPARFFAVPRHLAAPTTRPSPMVAYLGVELEIECHNSPVDRETVMAEVQHPLWRFKHDGSLRQGVEIVTFPLSVDVFRDAMPEWTRLFEQMDARNVVADDRANAPSQAGLHVHVNRSAFSPSALLKATAMVYRHPVFMTAISGRRSEDLRQWATLNENVIAVASKTSCSGIRYAAVNTTPTSTIEFRLFKSTTNPVLFAGRCLFPVALLTYCERTPARHLKMSSFIRWMEANGEWPEILALVAVVKPNLTTVGYIAQPGTLDVSRAISAASPYLQAAEAAALYAPTNAMRQKALRALFPRNRTREGTPTPEDDIARSSQPDVSGWTSATSGWITLNAP